MRLLALLLCSATLVSGCASISASSEVNPRGWAYLLVSEDALRSTTFAVDGEEVVPSVRHFGNQIRTQTSYSATVTTTTSTSRPALFLNRGRPYTTVTMTRGDARRDVLVPRSYNDAYMLGNMTVFPIYGELLDMRSGKNYRYPLIPVDGLFEQPLERVVLRPYWQ